MIKSIIPALVILLNATSLLAQKDETLIGATGLKFSGLWAGANIGMGLNGENEGMYGGFFGLEFNKALTLGYAGSNGTASITYNGIYRNYEIDYAGFLVGYAYQSYRVIHPRVSFLMGGGKLKVEDQPVDNIFVVQPSAGVEVNVFRWFRVGVEGGYRFVSNTNLPGPNDGDASIPFAQLSLRLGWSWGRE